MNTTTVSIDIEFANKYGLPSAFFLAFLRRYEVDKSPPLMRTYSATCRMFGLFSRATYHKALILMKDEGFIETEARRYKGRNEFYVCRLTDKAYKEYRFGE